MSKDGRRISSGGAGSRQPKKPTTSDDRFWHVARALEAARSAREAARTASAGLVQTGVGIAGIGLIVSTTARVKDSALYLAITDGLATVFFLVSLICGVWTLVRRRRTLFALVDADDAGFKEQLVRHGFKVDPQDEKSPEMYKEDRTIALNRAKQQGKESWMWIQFITLLGAFSLLSVRHLAPLWHTLRATIS